MRGPPHVAIRELRTATRAHANGKLGAWSAEAVLSSFSLVNRAWATMELARTRQRTRGFAEGELGLLYATAVHKTNSWE